MAGADADAGDKDCADLSCHAISEASACHAGRARASLSGTVHARPGVTTQWTHAKRRYSDCDSAPKAPCQLRGGGSLSLTVSQD